MFDLFLILSPGGQEEKLRMRGLVGCYALFQYLTVSIHAASAVYSQVREQMEELHHKLTPERQLNETVKPGDIDTRPSAADSSPTNRSHVHQLSSEREALSLQQVALLRFHNSTRVFPLATLRQTLTAALAAWPNSALLWSIYVQVCSWSSQGSNKISHSRVTEWVVD